MATRKSVRRKRNAAYDGDDDATDTDAGRRRRRDDDGASVAAAAAAPSPLMPPPRRRAGASVEAAAAACSLDASVIVDSTIEEDLKAARAWTKVFENKASSAQRQLVEIHGELGQVHGELGQARGELAEAEALLAQSDQVRGELAGELAEAEALLAQSESTREADRQLNDVRAVALARKQAALAEANNREKALRNIGALFANPLFSDVEVCCGGASFRAHKAIIAAQSDVFQVMLETRMVEGETNKIEVREMEPDVLKALLFYIYHGFPDPETWPDIAAELFAAAQLYNVEQLKKRCEETILKQLTDDPETNYVIRALIIADLHSNERIKDVAMDKAVGRASCAGLRKTMFKSDDWKKMKMEYPKLAVEVLEKAIDKPQSFRAMYHNY